MLRAENRRAIREHNERVGLAWRVAWLIRHKTLPKLEKLLEKDEAQRKPAQSMAQQIAVARMWSAFGYGKVTKPKG